MGVRMSVIKNESTLNFPFLSNLGRDGIICEFIFLFDNKKNLHF